MKFASLNKSYMVLAGIVLVMVVLVFYMWMDARRLQESLSPKSDPLPVKQVKQENANQVRRLTREDFPQRPQRKQLEPGEIVSGNPEPEEIPTQNTRPKRDEIVKGNKRRSKRGSDATAPQTDNWVFDTGRKVVEEKEVVEGETLVPE